MELIFDTISTLMVLPLLKTRDKDYTDITMILSVRAEELKAAAERTKEQSTESLEVGDAVFKQ